MPKSKRPFARKQASLSLHINNNSLKKKNIKFHYIIKHKHARFLLAGTIVIT